MATSNEREERRARLSERGLSRLSHITSGRTSSSSLPPLDLTNDEKKQSSDAQGEGAREDRSKIADKGLNRKSHIAGQSQSNPPNLDHNALFSDQIFAGPAVGRDNSTSSYLKHGSSFEISGANSLGFGGQTELKLQKQGTDYEIGAPSLGERGELQPLQETSSFQKASSNVKAHQKPCRNQPNIFSSKRLNSCIIASERTRSLCALLVALFVLLSYVDYPLLGMNIVSSESVVASRPLYIILLTDMTVVLGRLFLQKEGDSEEAENEKEGSENNRQNWAGAVKLLERGLVAYQTIRALFIDFSIYAVVIICGLSLM